MTNRTLALRSLRFYLRSHLGTVFGAAVATAVLTGALLVGDSVRGSLREMALARLGKIDFALTSGDRLFRAALADDLAKQIPDAHVAPALQLPASAINPESSARANQVQITGVDARFWTLANQPSDAMPSNGGEVWINIRLARQLALAPGNTILLRLPRVSHLSRDAPLAPEEDATVALRLTIGRIVSDAEFGRFGLSASQVPPLNAFIPLELLQTRVNATNQANLLLVSGGHKQSWESALPAVFTLADTQLKLSLLTNTPALEVRSPRVFLDTQISEAAMRADTNAEPVFTYFVNELSVGERRTPYSMVTGGSAVVPPDMRDDEILVNEWLAEDLQAKPGDMLTIKYFVMGLMRELLERTNTFRVRAVLPMELPFTDPLLMPDFPGMTDAENCRDWDTGLPINTQLIRDKDELYWDQYRGAPKAFITLRSAQELWSNRFGNLTAVRYRADAGAEKELPAAILRELKPRDLGFVFQPVRQQALSSSSGAQDFGGLFIGFSFFLIAAALLLMALLFRFALEQRGTEMGTLLALGFTPARVKRLLLAEGFGLAVIGGILGAGLAVVYARSILYALSTIWRDAVANSVLNYHGTTRTIVIGFLAGVFVAVITIWWSLRVEARRSARELLAEGLDSTMSSEHRAVSRKSLFGGAAALLAGLALAGWGFSQGEQARPDLFFSAGAMILIAGLMLTAAWIRRLEFSSLAERLSLTGMGVRSVTRRRKRSRAAVGLLACGAFLIASIGAFRLDSGKGAAERNSGTGGFALIGESSIPVVHNLNAAAGREFFGLNEKELQEISFVPFRMLEGEDASCLNLNRAQRPRILGVNPAHLQQRRSFSFSKILKGLSQSNPWLLLDRDFGPDVVPAIGDAASIQWALGKKIGDSLLYTGANGREFQVKIVGAVGNSILQGNLLISEKHFMQRFPTEAGYRMFLIDAPSNRAKSVAAVLSKAMQEVGLEVTPASERLAAFNAVQNTYLGTFQMLGGLGLLLGTLGLAVILLRNVFERRSELALLQAVGFQKPALRWLIVSEHAALLLLGLFIGVFAAIIAVAPSLAAPGSRLPYMQVGLTLAAVFLFGLFWTAVAAVRALSSPLLQSLRNE
jgi:putative ABC transport system permease protein